MISELNDEQILDFLMTSEFENDFSPEELKYLLVKFRFFYRLIHGKLEMSKNESDSIKKMLEDKIGIKEEYINSLLVENANLKNQLNLIGSKKLTLKERISGKIILQNEDK